MNRRFIILSILLLITSAPLLADEVVLQNGDRLTGTVENLVDGKLKFGTESVGTVTIDAANVAGLSTDQPVAVYLPDGTTRTAALSATEEGLFAIQEADGPQVYQLQDIAAINPPVEEEKEKTSFWKGKFTIGIDGTRGNSKTDNVSFAVDASHRGEITRVTVKSAYYYGREENIDTGESNTTKDSWVIESKLDYFLSKAYFTFLNGRYEYDRAADLDYRAMFGGGFGYQWIESPTRNFSTEAGVSYLTERYTGKDASEEMTGQFRYNFDTKLSDRVEFIHTLGYYPYMSDMSNYFLNTDAELRSSLTSRMYISLKTVMDYDSTPAPDKKSTDLKYIAGVGFTF